jgi:hypothetical protein
MSDEKMTRNFKFHLFLYLTIFILLPLSFLLYTYFKKESNGNRSKWERFIENINEAGTIGWKVLKKMNALFKYIAQQLSKPASASTIGLSNITIILLILLVSFFISYIRLTLGQKETKSKIMPHYTFNLLKNHPKTGNTLFGFLFIYLLFVFFGKFAKSNFKNNLPMVMKGGAGLLLFTSLYLLLKKHISNSTFTFYYKTYETTTQNTSNDDTKHLVWTSKKIPYMTAVNTSIIALPILFLIIKGIRSITQGTDFSMNRYHITVIGIFVLLYYTYPYIKDTLKKTFTNLIEKTVLLDKPIYMEDIKKIHGLPYNLGDYKSINQKYQNYQITDMTNLSIPNYSVTLWLWVDSVDSPDGDTFDTVLNYNNKPNILFNQSSQEIKILFDDGNKDTVEPKTIYLDQLKSQKWNYIVINYSTNTVQAYINTVLVTEQKNIMPNIKNIFYDSMSVGNMNNTLKCAVQKITYYPNILSELEIKYNHMVELI